MNLEKGYIYHIYNQGNNRRKIFFNRDNYLFFLKKIKSYVSPYADILAWSLMPNHFHLMVLVREVELSVQEKSNTMTRSHVVNTHRVTQSHPVSEEKRTLNNSIAIMLRSYTRAINKQENFSGKLFRESTKAECVNCPNGITPSFITKNGITQINIQDRVMQYPQICFDYIHQNPVKANLVNNTIDWEFSSVVDYAGLRDGKLINKKVAKEYFLVVNIHGVTQSHPVNKES